MHHTATRFLVGISLLGVCCLYGQKTKLPVFKKELYSLSQKANSNLVAKENDPVRKSVVEFSDQEDPIFNIPVTAGAKNLSVSLWFLPKNIDQHSGTLFAEKGLFNFRYLSNRKLQFNHYLKKDVTTAAILNSHTWQHVGFTLKASGALAIYFNGDLVLQDTIAADWWKKRNSRYSIGNDMYNIAAEGGLDDLKIWNAALTPQEFEDEYESTFLQSNLFHQLEVYLPMHGSIKDVSKQTKTISEVKEVVFVNDEVKGKVAKFMSGNSFVRVDDVNFDHQLTIAAWIKPKITSELQGVVGNKRFCLRLNAEKKEIWFNVPLIFKVQSGALQTDFQNNWNHIAITLSYNHKLNYYLNGVWVGSEEVKGKTLGDDYIKIGNSLWNNNFEGLICDVALWNRCLHPQEIASVYQGKLSMDNASMKSENKLKVENYWWFLAVLGGGLVFGFWYLQKKPKKQHLPEELANVSPTFPTRNAIFILGKFGALQKNGKDVSNEFTPTLIRLLVLIVVFPKLYNRHISSKEMSDILWASDDVAQQKNNRGTNIHRLRKLLKEFEGIALVYQDKSWKLESNLSLFFMDLLSFFNDKEESILVYPYESLQLCDEVKQTHFNEMRMQLNELHIVSLKNLCTRLYEEQQWQHLQKASTLWLTVDALSDAAITFVVLALLHQNKKQQAYSKYQSFVHHYQTTLNVNFKIKFEDLIAS